MRLLVGDNRESLKKFPDNFFDSCVTDPPYELTSILRRYSDTDAVPTKHPVYARVPRGFMGQAWDGTGVAFDSAFWVEVLRVLKPGGYLLAFGGSRTYHRLACAIEDAGFEIRDFLNWVFRTGFPKSLDCGEGRGSALKPGHEPICMARKPLEGTYVENIAAWATGAINISACRLGEEILPAQVRGVTRMGTFLGADGNVTPERVGRWPANVLLEHEIAEEEGLDKNFFVCNKASKADREDGCQYLPIRSGGELTGREDGTDGLNSPRAGAGRGGGRRNTHPTVKPTALMRYLVRLVTPPGGTCLDPFTGSGSTGRACALEGFDFVGMELSPEYTQIAAARIQASLEAAERGAA